MNKKDLLTESLVNALHSEGKMTESVDWNYYDKFAEITDKYMPDQGEGETMASQIVTAINKLIYKWYNDGDVYDNVNSGMQGWANDLSDYANWLDKYCKPASRILDSIYNCSNDDEYENILKALADKCLNEKYLSTMEEKPKQGSIYDCEGQYEFEEQDENDEWEDYTVDFDDEEDEDEDYYDDDEYLDSMDESKTKLIKESAKSSNYIQDRADMLLSYKDAIINYIASATPNNIREYEILDATKLLERILKLCDWVNDQKQFLTKVYNNPDAVNKRTLSLKDYIEEDLSKNTGLVKELTEIENIVSSTNYLKTESKLIKESKEIKTEASRTNKLNQLTSALDANNIPYIQKKNKLILQYKNNEYLKASQSNKDSITYDSDNNEVYVTCWLSKYYYQLLSDKDKSLFHDQGQAIIDSAGWVDLDENLLKIIDTLKAANNAYLKAQEIANAEGRNSVDYSDMSKYIKPLVEIAYNEKYTIDSDSISKIKQISKDEQLINNILDFIKSKI